MNKFANKSLNSLALMRLKKNPLAWLSLAVLGALYLCAIFADFISPYSYDNENRLYSYCPPAKIRWVDSSGRISAPFIYDLKLGFDDFHRRVYTTDKTKTYPVKLWVRGDRYKLFGLVSCRRHLFGLGESAPARIYLWGADSRGRDLFSRILYGGRISLSVGLLGVAISFSLGMLVGGISGFYGGRTDNLIMRLCEMIMLVPGFYLMLALRAAFPPALSSAQVYILIVLIFSFIGWAGLARVIRGMSISLRERDYCLAARSLGLSNIKIITRHILPHTLSYAIPAAALSVPAYILGESGLSLIGLGIQDPVPSWGNLLSEAMSIVQIRFAPWILIPGIFIFLTVMAFNFFGDCLRDAFDPLLKSEGIDGRF